MVSADSSSLMGLAGKLQRPDRARMIMSAAAESHMLSYLSIMGNHGGGGIERGVHGGALEL